MIRLTNTDQVSGTDRQASGNQPDNSTPTGSTPTGVVPPPPSTGTVTSITEDGSDTVELTPDPITTTGTIGLKNIGGAAGPVGDSTHVAAVTIDNYGRVSALSSVAIAFPSPGTGTVTSVTAGTGLTATPNPIVAAGTISMPNVGTPSNYQRVTTDAQGRVSAGENDVFNIKQYGADPANSAAVNTAAINAAIAAMSSYTTLYIPGGKYPITAGGINAISGLTGITICGEGWSSELFSAATGATGNLLVVDGTCDHVTIRDLAIVGSATVRGSGVGLRMYASDAQVVNLYIQGCSDFAIHIDGDGSGTTVYSQNVQVLGCYIKAPLGDGIHVSACKNYLISHNLLDSTGDDSIAAVSESNSFPPTRGVISNNLIYNSGFRSITVLEAFDFEVSGNLCDTSVSAGIEVSRFNSTSAYNTRGKVIGNKCYNNATSAGPIGVIQLFWCVGVDCSENLIDTPATASVSGMSFLDCLNVAITRNTIKASPAYGIRGYDFGAPHVGATQGPLSIKGNIIFACADYAVYCVADTGATIFNFMVCENEAYAVSGAAKAVFWDKVNTGRIANNTSLGFAYTAGGTVTAVTTFNNN